MIPLHLDGHLSASMVLLLVASALKVETDPGILARVTGLSARVSGPPLAQMAIGEVH